MEGIKWSYFQFRKSYDYPIYIRCREDEVQGKFTHVFTEMGFTLLTEQETKKISLHRAHLRILSIQGASPRLEAKINGSDLLDKYGPESLSLQMGMPVYTYRKVGVMGLPLSKNLWDLAMSPSLEHTEQMVGFRVILTRYLSQSLAELGVLCFWGTVKDDTVVIMKQSQSFGEAIIIDASKKMIFSSAGEMKIGSSLKLIRKDKETSRPSRMSREDIIGFMSVSTCLLSFNGISHTMKKAIYDLSTSINASYAVTEVQANL